MFNRCAVIVVLAMGFVGFGVMRALAQVPPDTSSSLPATQATTQPATSPSTDHLPFASFSFGISDRPAQEQVALLQKLGFDGITVGMYGSGEGVGSLRAYASVPAVKEGKFQVYAILWWATAKKPYDPQWLDQVLAEAARMHAALWVVVDTAEGDRTGEDQATLDLLNAAADACAKHDVQLVLYPHDGCVFRDTEQALAIREKLTNHPEVKVSLHVCHELKANKMDQIAETVRKAAPYLSLVSVSGADMARIHEGGWKYSIIPLDEGNLDLRPLLAALKEVGYAGPVALHTYGITEQPEDHLPRSMKWWKSLENGVNAQRLQSAASQPASAPTR